MSGPFSDTTSQREQLPAEWEHVAQLVDRLGLPSDLSSRPSKWQAILVAGLHKILDRLEKIEAGG